ncbi:hypothetical protein EMCRGX_G033357 [Ephydatia muelleri]
MNILVKIPNVIWRPVFETVKCCMEVSDTIPSCEAAKHTCMNPSCQRWTTFATSSGIYIRGTLLISSPPEGSIKGKDSEMPEDLSHLKKAVIYDCCYVLSIVCIPSKKS